VCYFDNFWHEYTQMKYIGYCETTGACLSKSVKDADELKLRLIETWSGIHKSIIDQAIDQWRVRLKACVDAKGKHFEHVL